MVISKINNPKRISDLNQSGAGFTLIELLVVIAIIGILSAIGLVSLNGAREKARDAKRKSDLSSMRAALILYYDDRPSTGIYPIQTLAGPLAGISGDLVPSYIAGLPTDPTGTYYYISSTFGELYALFVKLEGGSKNWYITNSYGIAVELYGSASFAFNATKMRCSESEAAVGSMNLCNVTPYVTGEM
jgi:prepilin-type N-terminal cleavage/methylation domain-containing protein